MEASRAGTSEPLTEEPSLTEPAADSAPLSSPRATPRASAVSALLARPYMVDALALAALVLAVAFLWGRALGTWFWEDEAIAVGVAEHSLGQIPEVLRQDGSPPFYYALLHVWMSLFGTSEVATHVLSLIFGVAIIPIALWAGWSLFGRRAGWICAGLAALNPYLALFSTETRMYSLVALLSVLVSAAFLHAFVYRRRKYAVMFAVALVLLMYTHNWGILFAAGAGLALVPCLVQSSDRKRLFLDAALAFGAAALAYLPWLPTLLYQRSQDLQPWALPATLVDVRDTVVFVLGGIGVATALALVFGLGVAAMAWRPWSRPALSVVALGVIAGVVLLGGWRTVLTYRYMGAVLGPLLIALAAALAYAGRMAIAAIAVAILLTAPIGAKGPPYQKSNARAVGESVAPSLRPGDIVLSPNFEFVPLAAYYLPDGLRYLDANGPVPDVGVVDWRDANERLRRGDPARTLPPVINDVPVGGRVLVVCPPTGAGAPALQGTPGAESIGPSTEVGEGIEEAAVGQTTPVPNSVVLFHALNRFRCKQVQAMLREDRRLELEQELIAPVTDVRATAMDGLLFEKVTNEVPDAEEAPES
ncbi:MAG: glycosyltransferase family 39 protein [Actinomycetota bacterium]|nr:glycosyltransferase family 39 protein [Actinomycetota bacterium]